MHMYHCLVFVIMALMMTYMSLNAAVLATDKVARYLTGFLGLAVAVYWVIEIIRNRKDTSRSKIG